MATVAPKVAPRPARLRHGDSCTAPKYCSCRVERAARGLEALNDLVEQLDQLKARVHFLQNACVASDDAVCQVLGKALGYPWYKDDQKHFPGADERHGVCVGDHTGESLAVEAAKYLKCYREALQDILTGDDTRNGAMAIAKEALG